jgi:hypothetical protein
LSSARRDGVHRSSLAAAAVLWRVKKRKTRNNTPCNEPSSVRFQTWFAVTVSQKDGPFSFSGVSRFLLAFGRYYRAGQFIISYGVGLRMSWFAEAAPAPHRSMSGRADQTAKIGEGCSTRAESVLNKQNNPSRRGLFSGFFPRAFFLSSLRASEASCANREKMRRKYSLDRGKSENFIAAAAVTRKTSEPASGSAQGLKPRMTSEPLLQDKTGSRVVGLFGRAGSKSAEASGGGQEAAAQEQLHLLRRASESALEMEKELQRLRETNSEMEELLRQQYVEIEVLTTDKSQRDQLDEEHETYKKLERTNSFLMQQRVAIACRQYAAETESRLQSTQEELRKAQEELRRTAAQQRDMLARFQELAAQWEMAKKEMGNSNRQCLVCNTRPRSHACVPCGHFSMCGQCAPIDDCCPVCTSPTKETVFVVF